MESQYIFNREAFKNDAAPKEAMKHIQPPIRMALNKDIICDCVNTITAAYKNSPDSTYAKIASSLFWSFGYLH